MDPTPGQTPRVRKQFTLRFTLVSAFCGLTLLGGFFLSSVTSLKVGEFIREELRLRLSDTVSLMASQLDGERHSRIQAPEDETSPDYLAMQETLRAMRLRGTGIAYAYTMRKQADGSIIFVVDSAEPGEDFSHVGDAYDDATPTLLAALSASAGNTRPFVEQEPSKDEWGTWLSAFAPVYTANGTLDGVVGIDVSAESVILHEQQYKYIVWLFSAGVVLLVLPLGLVFARRIRQPLAQLADEMQKVRQFELDSEVNIQTRIREIDSMVQQLENMKRGLRAFRKYVPDDLVRELIELGVEARLGGARRELTVFFSDIANFTTLSEKLSPETLVQFLGEYLNIMNANLLQHRATVDKYIGDGVMAFWGAPRPMEAHALRACEGALACQTGIRSLNEKWQREGLGIDFHTRIGINTGDVIVGNMGSDERMSYTVIGDNVNLTSRLEGINKYYGTCILLTESTRQQVREHMLTRQVDKVILAGKTIPIAIHELLARRDEADPALQALANRYDAAFALYSQQAFAEAEQQFAALLADYPQDSPTQVMLARCRQFLAAPPAPDWDGSFVFESK